MLRVQFSLIFFLFSLFCFAGNSPDSTEKEKNRFVAQVQSGLLIGKKSFSDNAFYPSNAAFLALSYFAGIRTGKLTFGFSGAIEDYSRGTLIPVEFGIKYKPLNKRVSPVFALQSGHALAWPVEKTSTGYQSHGGFSFYTGSGLSINKGNGTSFLLSCGYRFQKGSAEFSQWGGGSTTEKFNYKRLYLSLGFEF
jgi:hypothetical protein